MIWVRETLQPVGWHEVPFVRLRQESFEPGATVPSSELGKSVDAPHLQSLSTGVQGLDEILFGGLDRYVEAGGEVSKGVSVLEKRLGGHQKSIRELRFDAGGIAVSASFASRSTART